MTQIHLLLSAAALVGAALPSLAQDTDRDVRGPLHTVSGRVFQTLSDYRASGLVGIDPLRCLTPPPTPGPLDDPADCSLSLTDPQPQYDPIDTMVIPVVFHVIRNSSGSQGNIPLAQIQNQVDILNEDFEALVGTPGANGFACAIRFELATTDPAGNPTTGVTYSNNNSWFNDSGSYWNSLAWNPFEYLNIYTNNASGALGYVPFLPQQGGVGSAADRVVVLWSTVGRNAPFGFPYNQGRTVTHEVGHYLGLLHTFDGSCGSASACFSTGDLICDTNPESGPEFGCAVGSSSCGSLDPVRNYMNYSYDTCMQEFTSNQSSRMRCTLQSYRPTLGYTIPAGPGVPYCDVVANSTGQEAELAGVGTNEAALNDLTLEASLMPANQFGYLLASQTQALVPFPGTSSGNLCLGGTIGRFVGQVMNTGGSGAFDVPVDLTSIPLSPPVAVQAGETWNFQVWFRDTSIVGSTSNFTNGFEVAFE